MKNNSVHIDGESQIIAETDKTSCSFLDVLFIYLFFPIQEVERTHIVLVQSDECGRMNQGYILISYSLLY